MADKKECKELVVWHDPNSSFWCNIPPMMPHADLPGAPVVYTAFPALRLIKSCTVSFGDIPYERQTLCDQCHCLFTDDALISGPSKYCYECRLQRCVRCNARFQYIDDNVCMACRDKETENEASIFLDEDEILGQDYVYTVWGATPLPFYFHH